MYYIWNTVKRNSSNKYFFELYCMPQVEMLALHTKFTLLCAARDKKFLIHATIK